MKLIAERMGTNPDTDMRPGLLIQLAFGAADFAFQQWVRRSSDRRATGSLCHRGPGSGQESPLDMSRYRALCHSSSSSMPKALTAMANRQ